MGKLLYISAATAKPQITTITISGTWAAGETVTLKVAEKEVVYTATGTPTPTTVAAGLMALAQASEDPEFSEIDTWEANAGVITATGIDGIPITIAASETAASGSVAVSNTQAATGPYHWDNVDNWSTGAAPTTNDEVYFESAEAIAKYGLPTSLTLDRFVCRLGQVGLPDWNESGYREYRTKRATFSCTDVQIGTSPGVGPALCRINTSTSAAIIAVWGSTQRRDYAPIDVLANSSSAALNVQAGQVALAPSGDETSTVGTVRVSAEGAVTLGAGVTVTTVLSAGQTAIYCSPTNLTVDNGNTTLLGAAAVSGTTIVRGGTLLWKSTGTIAAATVGPGLLDCSQDMRSRTVSSLTLKKDGQLYRPYEVITITALALADGSDRLQAS